MNIFRFAVSFLLAVQMFIVISGCCSPKIVLKPASTLQRLTNVQDAVQVNCAGIRIIVEAGAWYGPENDGKEIVPLHITISNNSGFPIFIRYSDFYMIGLKTGNVYRALPPYQFANAVESNAARLPEVFTFKPDFTAEKFGVAHYCSDMYPDLPVWKGMFIYKRLFYEHYYPVWAKKRVHSFEALLQSEIPEGVILDGGFVNGFLYFETFSKAEKKVFFNFGLCEARRGLLLEKISIPFTIE
ncbi:MAG TPA: hypothetical protein VHO70_09265 [Chitinispirillaceae bacterium]|nr:hypothetical protein [Chitinispirillaceae bacterium]